MLAAEMAEIARKCYELPARAKFIINVASMLAEDHYPESFHDNFFDDLSNPVVPGSIIAEMPELVKMRDPADVAEALQNSGRLGFLVEVATPVKRITGKNSSKFSWGCYSTAWFYGDSFEVAMEKGFLWAEEKEKTARLEYLRVNQKA
jgi:hypothetical protein